MVRDVGQGREREGVPAPGDRPRPHLEHPVVDGLDGRGIPGVTRRGGQRRDGPVPEGARGGVGQDAVTLAVTDHDADRKRLDGGLEQGLTLRVIGLAHAPPCCHRDLAGGAPAWPPVGA